MDDLLAVYGTLMRGLAPPAAPATDRTLELVGACRIPGTLFDCGPYPALVPEPSERGVVGELYRIVDHGALVALDAYEGFVPNEPTRSLFVRARVRLLEPDVWSWVYHGGTAHRIAVVPSGDWRAHLRDRRTPPGL